MDAVVESGLIALVAVESAFNMECLFPVIIKNPHYGEVFVNGRVNQEIDSRYIKVPCGKCPGCMVNRRREWFTRLALEEKICTNNFFITLTYDNENLPRNGDIPTVRKRDCQLFFKRLRKSINNHRIKYYLGSEYGTSFSRPHYHFILFNSPYAIEETYKVVNSSWQKGFVNIGTVTDASINYVAKYYVLKLFSNPPGSDPLFQICSKNLGSGYLKQKDLGNIHNITDRPPTIKDHGINYRIGRYLKDRIFTESEKSIIASNARKYYDAKSPNTDDELSVKVISSLHHAEKQKQNALKNQKL